MAQLYSNENFLFPTVEELRKLGHDVLTTLESGRAGLRIPFVTLAKRIDSVLKASGGAKGKLIRVNRPNQ